MEIWKNYIDAPKNIKLNWCDTVAFPDPSDNMGCFQDNTLEDKIVSIDSVAARSDNYFLLASYVAKHFNL